MCLLKGSLNKMIKRFQDSIDWLISRTNQKPAAVRHDVSARLRIDDDAEV